ncbi:MAG TPA: hypothetical protein VJA21_02115 [Verrucomicrobiae bacterium]
MNNIYKPNVNGTSGLAREPHGLGATCLRCYERVLRGLGAVKVKTEREFGRAMAGYEQLLKAAVNEAEALAWQTSYPHLLFPTLAEEKAAAAQQWVARQRAIREQALPWALAA